MQREKVYNGVFDKVTWIQELRAEQTILRFRDRNLKALSPSDKDALIAAMSIVIIASAQGLRPSPSLQSIFLDDIVIV
jgi:hypothetical protein